MPEGPEIRRSADLVAGVLVGRRAERVFFAFPHLKTYEDELTGRRVRSVESRGKAMLTSFAGGLHVYSHNQLYGLWKTRPEGASAPSTRRSLRFAVHTSAGSALLYSASEIAVLDEQGLREHPYLKRLGPDVLAPELRPSRIARRLNAPAFRGRSLGALLLDQSFLAGLGNYLRSEILFDAGVAAEARPRDLSSETRLALARSCRTIARRSYRTGGITNPPERVAELAGRGVPRRRHRFAVFARGGERCYRCRGTIRKRDVAGRRLYECRLCQEG